MFKCNCDNNYTLKTSPQELESLLLEFEGLKQEQASFKQRIEAAEKAIKSYQEQVNAMADELSKTKVKVNTIFPYLFRCYV